jgi:hypothetical protein
MSVPFNKLSQYKTDWLEVRDLSGRGYADEVLSVLNDEGETHVTVEEIYRVKSGIKKDLKILAAIRRVLLPEETASTEISTKGLNLQKP